MGRDNRQEVREKVSELEDIEPLFATHEFWQSQPVPQPADELTLPDVCFNTAIRVQTADEVK